jgi:hypothetical protein
MLEPKIIEFAIKTLVRVNYCTRERVHVRPLANKHKN